EICLISERIDDRPRRQIDLRGVEVAVVPERIVGADDCAVAELTADPSRVLHHVWRHQIVGNLLRDAGNRAVGNWLPAQSLRVAVAPVEDALNRRRGLT